MERRLPYLMSPLASAGFSIAPARLTPRSDCARINEVVVAARLYQLLSRARDYQRRSAESFLTPMLVAAASTPA
jgi:hypothetical protein